MWNKIFGFLTRNLPTILTWVIGKLTKASPEDWQDVIRWVQAAEGDDSLRDGLSRKTWVLQQIKMELSHLVPFAQDLLLSLAVGYLAQQGLIHVKQIKN